MKKDKLFTIKLSAEEYDNINRAFLLYKAKHKKPKGYKMGSYMREVALRSAKRMLKE